MVVLCGKGGAGKDTVSKILQDVYGIPKVVTYTTRPKRQGEKDGESYHFITKEEFLEKMKSGFFAETSCTGEHMYGSPAEAFKEKNAQIILDPAGIGQVTKKIGSENLQIFFLDADEDLLRQRMSERGDAPEKIEERLKEDNVRFENIEKYSGFTICQNGMTLADEIALFISCMVQENCGAS